MVKDFRIALRSSAGTRVSAEKAPPPVFLCSCVHIAISALERSAARCSSVAVASIYLAVFAHPLESRRERLLYSQCVLLGKRGGNCPFCTPLATPLKFQWMTDPAVGLSDTLPVAKSFIHGGRFLWPPR